MEPTTSVANGLDKTRSMTITATKATKQTPGLLQVTEQRGGRSFPLVLRQGA